MVRIGVPSAIAFNAGTAVSTGSATTVVFAHVSGGVRVFENTILGSSAIRGNVGSSLVAAVRGAKFLADWHSPLPTQAALADFIDQGLFARHLRRMRAVYQERHEQIVESLADRFADHLKPVPSAAGLHVAATAPSSTPEELQATLGRASAAGVEVQPLSMFDVGPPSQPGIVLGYGAIPTADIDEGLTRLRRCFDG